MGTFCALLFLALLSTTSALKCRRGYGLPSNKSLIPVEECSMDSKSCENVTTTWFNTTYFTCSVNSCVLPSGSCQLENERTSQEERRCCCSTDGCNSAVVVGLSLASMALAFLVPA